MIFTGHSHGQEEISRLEKIIGMLSDEKRSIQWQVDELRCSNCAQLIAEWCCEATEELEVCLKAWLQRPQRFAETGRRVLDAERAPKSPYPEQDPSTRTAVKSGQPEPR